MDGLIGIHRTLSEHSVDFFIAVLLSRDLSDVLDRFLCIARDRNPRTLTAAATHARERNQERKRAKERGTGTTDLYIKTRAL